MFFHIFIIRGYNMSIVENLRIKYQHLKNLLDAKKDESGTVPFSSKFIGSIQDFIIISNIEALSDEELLSTFSAEDINHLISSIDSYEEYGSNRDKFDFSLRTIIQLDNFMNGTLENCDELLQTLYMTIFQRYNDDIKLSENYQVTPEFANKVYRFNSEKTPTEKKIESSEKDIGYIYMTYEDYKNLLEIWEDKNKSLEERQALIKDYIVNYTLSNIRKRMMHGDFENTTDKQGNKIVNISPYGFKSKFFFDCILEFYSVVAEEIRTKTRKEDCLFELESLLLNSKTLDSSPFNEPDKMMMVVLPLYINGFITYNFNDTRKDIQKLRKQIIENAENSEAKAEFLDIYYKKKKTDSFAYKVAEYNEQHFAKNYTAYDIINHFRNSVVHNNFKCENGMVYFRDFNTDGVETAKFMIPYNLIIQLIKDQSKQAKKVLGQSLPDAPSYPANKTNTSTDIER